MPRRPLSSRRPNPAARMGLRQWHTYIGAFIAPSVLFFALTGIVQLFSLHEAHDGYKPPTLIEKLSSVHKDQLFRLGEHHDEDGPPKAGPRAGPDTDKNDADKADAKRAPSAAQIRTWVLKWVFTLVGLGLIVSTLIGLWLALSAGRQRGVTVLLILIGAAVPILLLAL